MDKLVAGYLESLDVINFIRMLFVCIAAFCLGCSEGDTDNNLNDEFPDMAVSWVATGKIDEKFYESIIARKPETTNIIVHSIGGETRMGLKIAREIFDNQLDVTIVELCLSACAEYILPSAKKVYLADEPLIGYHRNPIILGHLLRKNATRDLEHCTKIGDKELLELLADTGKKTDAWIKILERIELKYYRVDYKENECPWSAKTFKNDLWFPTSAQLEVIFGITFSGKLCADSEDCYLKKLEAAFKHKGGSFIVGDKKVTVEKSVF